MKDVVCTHVHDNYHGDDHLLPFLGQIDWKTMTTILREAGYSGNITLELVYGAIPPVMKPDFLAYARRTVDELINMVVSPSEND